MVGMTITDALEALEMIKRLMAAGILSLAVFSTAPAVAQAGGCSVTVVRSQAEANWQARYCGAAFVKGPGSVWYKVQASMW